MARKKTDNAATLDFDSNTTSSVQASEKPYAEVFRRIYFHLYTNSNASRAERIVTDLSNLLLCKIASERSGAKETVDRYLIGEGTANELLLPILLKSFPHLVAEEEKFVLDDSALRTGLQELESLSFASAPAHILGEAFQSLMGPRLRGDKGQFFTPKSLVRAIVSTLNPKPNGKVVDPACGTAGFLVETHAHRVANYPNTKCFGQLVGLEKDRDLSRLSEAVLEIAAPHGGTIWNVNSLDIRGLSELPEEGSPFGADYVLTNPPFGTKIKVTEKEILRQFFLGRQGQDPQILFLELCIRLLKPGGKLGIVLPEGVFGNSGQSYVWDYVRTQGDVVALLDCPRTTFQPSTDVKTNVLFFQKSATTKVPSIEEVWTAVALQCGHDRRGRSVRANGDPYPDDFRKIDTPFEDEKRSEIWQRTRLTNPYYLVPRYYDSGPVRELRDEAKRLGTEVVNLGELVHRKVLKIKKGHEVGAEAYGTGDVPFVRTSDISNYEISIDPTKSVNEEVYEQYAAHQKLKPGDILMVTDGRYRIGRTAILNEHNYKCVVQSHLRVLSVAKNSSLSSVELLYLLNLPMVQHQIRNLVFIQSTLGNLGARLQEVLVPLPPPSPEWAGRVQRFRELIEGRANLLQQLREFEHPGYDL